MSVCMKTFYFPIQLLEWQISNSEKSLVLACCITYFVQTVKILLITLSDPY